MERIVLTHVAVAIVTILQR